MPTRATNDFLQTLRGGRFLLDGGMGTSLIKLGLKSEDLALACLEQPVVVEQVHRGFLEAGSQWIQTNTFAANRLALQSAGASVPVGDLNRTAALLARRQVQAHGSGWVAGNLGPAGAWANPRGSIQGSLLEEVYAEQGTGLLAGGVDLFSLETFGDSSEACLALATLRRISDLPVVISFTFIEKHGEFFTLSGEPLLPALLLVQDAGADVVGVNCADGSAQTLACIETLAGHFRVPLTAKPNAGIPLEGSDGTAAPQSPEQFARDMLAVSRGGVCAVGGCCGADSRFIEALRAELDQDRRA